MIGRALGLVALGFALLVAQSTLYHAIPWGPATPTLVLPLLLAMGLAGVAPAWGSPIAFVLGYMADAVSGNPMGLLTIVSVGTFLFGTAASGRLFVEGIPFQVLLTFVASMGSSLTVLGLRWVFERGWRGSEIAWLDLVLGAAATAVAAPAVFFLAVRVVPRRGVEERVTS
jgi:cell shape-determining protein MreD